RSTLDQASLVEKEHLVAEAPRLAEVMGGHDDLGSRGVEGANQRLDFARCAWIEACPRVLFGKHTPRQPPARRHRPPAASVGREDPRRLAAATRAPRSLLPQLPRQRSP